MVYFVNYIFIMFVVNPSVHEAPGNTSFPGYSRHSTLSHGGLLNINQQRVICKFIFQQTGPPFKRSDVSHEEQLFDQQRMPLKKKMFLSYMICLYYSLI